MAESKALYYGAENRGAATILPSESPNLFQVMDDLQARRDADEELKRQEAKARGEQMNKMLDYAPEAVWQEYDSEIQKDYNEYLDFTKSKYTGGRFPSDDDSFEVKRRQASINAKINYYNQYKEDIGEARERITKGEEAKYYNQDFFEEYMGAVNYDEKGNKRSMNELSPDLITNIYNEKGLYNWDEIDSGFVDNFGKLTFEKFKEENYGQSITTEEMSNIFELDPVTNEPEVDANGNYILKVSDKSFKSAMDDSLMSKHINYRKQEMEEATGQPISNFEAFEDIMAGYSDRSTKIKTKYDPRLNTWAKESYGNKKKEEEGYLRKKQIAEIQAGNPEMLSELKGAKSGKKYATDVKYNADKGVIILTYDDMSEEEIPSGDFNRLNDLISTKPNQAKVSQEILANIPEAEKVEPYQQLDDSLLNQDIDLIQKGDGKEIIEALPGVESVEYDKPLLGSKPTSLIISKNGEDIVIDITSQNAGGYNDIKKFILDNDSESYKKVRGAEKEKIEW